MLFLTGFRPKLHGQNLPVSGRSHWCGNHLDRDQEHVCIRPCEGGTVDCYCSVDRGMEELTIANEAEEFMFLGLRETSGVSSQRFREIFGRPVLDVSDQSD